MIKLQSHILAILIAASLVPVVAAAADAPAAAAATAPAATTPAPAAPTEAADPLAEMMDMRDDQISGDHTEHRHNPHMNMDMDEKGSVMNANTDKIPEGCTGISEEVKIEVHAGRKYAKKFNGLMWAFDKQEWKVKPCARVTIKLVNDDHIRHQWMIHGLPKFIYPQGMFHVEVNGPGEREGTIIIPGGNRTYLVHCDIAQHMEKGMKAQLKGGEGSGDLTSLPGMTGNPVPDKY
jgi:FtsP/CotA-like multicopper oxidase with cupredoxin domain